MTLGHGINMKFDFRPGDKVILMSVKDIQQMVNLWTPYWRNEVTPAIIQGRMESMCDGKTVRTVSELSPSGSLWVDYFYFPPEIATLATKRPEKSKIRFIRR